MKLLSPLICVALSAGTALATNDTRILSFDDVPVGFDHVPMPQGYGNLQWSNFRVANGWNQPWNSGYRLGMVSPNNVAFNPNGDPAGISCATLFDFDSAYLTAGVLDTLQVRIQGLVGENLLYDNTYVLNLTEPSLITFNYRGVDQVRFIPSPGSQFVMDHLTITFPGPNTNHENCSFEISPRSRLHGPGSETASVAVTTSTGCAWSLSNTNPWVSLVSNVNQTNSGAVTYSVTANPSAVARNGFIHLADQVFAISQSGDPSVNAHPPVDLGQVEVSRLGHSLIIPRLGPGPFPPMPNSVVDFLIDEDQSSGGGAVLPLVSVNWDTNSQFVLTVSAPSGQKFLVQVPPGREAAFVGYLTWGSTWGGSSPFGSVTVRFEGTEGAVPDFVDSEAVLSATHGYFGFSDITSSTFSGELAFTSISMTGNASPQYTGLGLEEYVLHQESSLQIFYSTFETADPGPFVSIVPVAPSPRIRIADVAQGAGAVLFLQGQAGRTNVVESSDDLRHWTPISTNVMPFTRCAECPFVNLVDATATNSTCRFYRTFER